MTHLQETRKCGLQPQMLQYMQLLVCVDGAPSSLFPLSSSIIISLHFLPYLPHHSPLPPPPPLTPSPFPPSLLPSSLLPHLSPSITPHSSKHVSLWFIGLEFKKSTTGGVNITITHEIQVFSNAGPPATLSIALQLTFIYRCLHIPCF